MRSKVKEVKRKLAIVGGDEDLVPLKVITFPNLVAFESWLTGDYRRRSLSPDASAANVRNALRLDGSSSGPLSMVPLSEYRRKRNFARNVQIDKRCSRKLELNLGWSDQTEVVHHLSFFLLTLQEEYFGILSDAYRCFRNLTFIESPSDVETDADSVFSSANSVSSVSSAGSSRSVSRYRQRYGRNGRVYVDRTLTADEKDDLEKTQFKMILQDPVLEERWKFDPRASEDQKPVLLDEFSIEYDLHLKHI